MSAHAQRYQVPMTRLDNEDPELMDELLEVVQRVAATARFILGPEVEAFEAEWAGYCGAEHAVAVSSGTDALILALRALDIGPGDEVVIPANSFVATAEAVSLVGATPCFVDVDPRTALLNPDVLRAAIGPHTRCLIVVHLYGRTLPPEPLMRLAAERGMAVIEDACQAHGALMGNRRAGTLGNAGCFSFYPAKNLGAWGDAGALVTDDARLAQRVRLLRTHGERIRYHHETVGTTARLDEIQAAILRVKLRRLDAWNDARRHVGSALTAALRGGPVIPPAPADAGSDHVFHQFVVQSDERDRLRAHLMERGVATAIHYPVPIHQTPAYAVRSPSRLPVAEALAKRILSLPIYPAMSEQEVGLVADAIADFRAD
jgi:dTDP-3-amino-3,4,6-trideoxy-alpha-D-glucose transaminase